MVEMVCKVDVSMFVVAALGLVELMVPVMKVTLVVSELDSGAVCIAILVPSSVVDFVVETFVAFIMNVSLAINDCFCFIFRYSK